MDRPDACPRARERYLSNLRDLAAGEPDDVIGKQGTTSCDSWKPANANSDGLSRMPSRKPWSRKDLRPCGSRSAPGQIQEPRKRSERAPCGRSRRALTGRWAGCRSAPAVPPLLPLARASEIAARARAAGAAAAPRGLRLAPP